MTRRALGDWRVGSEDGDGQGRRRDAGGGGDGIVRLGCSWLSLVYHTIL
jgi:hypothetical protein